MNKNRNSNFLSDLALLYIITWLIAPPLAYGTVYRIFFIGAIGLIGISTLNSGNRYFTNIFGGFLVLIAFFSILSIFNGVSLTYKFGEYIFILCSALVVPHFCTSKNVLHYNYLIVFTFILCIVFNYTTLQGIAVNSNVMRDLAKNSDFSLAYAKRGIGGYGYCYSVLLLIPIALDYTLDRYKRISQRVISLMFLISTYYMVFMSAYFIAIIIAIICLPLHFILRINNMATKYFAVVILIVFSIILYYNLETIIYLLAQNMSPGTIKRKLLEIVSISQAESGIESGEFGERYARYVKDLRYMLTSPIWGTLDRDNGNHSFILDRFASYGVIVGGFYFTQIKKTLNAYGYWHTAATKTVVIIAGILLFMNSLAPGVAVALFIISPIYCLGKKEQMEYE